MRGQPSGVSGGEVCGAGLGAGQRGGQGGSGTGRAHGPVFSGCHQSAGKAAWGRISVWDSVHGRWGERSDQAL